MKPPIYEPHIATLYNYSGDAHRLQNSHNPLSPLPMKGPDRPDYVMYGNPELRRKYQDNYLGVVATNLEENAYYSAENRGLEKLNQYYKPIEKETNYGIGNYIGMTNTATVYPDINSNMKKAQIKFF